MLIKNDFIKSISDISNNEFERISDNYNSPFMSYKFLKSMEESGSASSSSGWHPHHAVSYNNETLNEFMPLYLKNNSRGEFVFDQQWSYALDRANRNYYPKFLTAIPFTPCETPKLISNNYSNFFALIETTKEKMKEMNIESWHVLYPDYKSKQVLKENGFIERFGYRFVWNNRNFSNFENFLGIFTSRQRKNIKKEREGIKKLGITFYTLEEDSLELKDWKEFYKFYTNTYYQRMQQPYLNMDFFKLIHGYKDFLKPVIFFAKRDDKIIGGSLCFRGEKTLYGRHWGCEEDIPNLHFECCYYQGIDYCIKNNIHYYDPGIQGEYKIRRGFEPVLSNSFHYILHKDFRDAINQFCKEEKKHVMGYFESCKEYTPIKKEYRI